MIASSQICFKLYENKDVLTKQNNQAEPPHTQKLQTKLPKKFALLLTTICSPLHPTLLRGLGVKLADF